MCIYYFFNILIFTDTYTHMYWPKFYCTLKHLLATHATAHNIDSTWMHFISLRRILNTPTLITYKRHMISIYHSKTMNLNKRSRRRRNINMAQHETTKMPVRLPKRRHPSNLLLCIPTYNFALKSFARFTFQLQFYTKTRQIYQIYGYFS